MKITTLISLILLLHGMLYANENLSSGKLPFDGLDNTTVTYFDVDGDKDKDVLLVDKQTFEYRFFENNSTSNTISFIERTNLTSIFETLQEPTVHTVDVDNDGYTDIFIQGLDGESKPVLKHYRTIYSTFNEGYFFQDAGNLIYENVSSPSFLFEDLDSDGDKDILIRGYSTSQKKLVTNIFRHDYFSTYSIFTHLPDLQISGISFSFRSIPSGYFIDIDQDGDKDMFCNSPFEVYLNTSTPENINFETIAPAPSSTETYNHVNAYFMDLDSDGDLDFIMKPSYNAIECYRNLGGTDETVSFEKVTGIAFDNLDISSPFTQNLYSHVEVSIRNTNQRKVLYNSSTTSQINFEEVLTIEDPENIYTPTKCYPLQCNIQQHYLDVNNDGYSDIIKLWQHTTLKESFFNIYTSTSARNFNNSLTNLFSDKGYLSNFVIVKGLTTQYEEKNMIIIFIEKNGICTAKLVTNLENPDNIDTQDITGITLDEGFFDISGRFRSTNFVDIDSDGDKDLLLKIKDESTNNYTLKIYENQSTNNNLIFVESQVEFPQFTSVNISSFMDLNGDKQKDIIIQGVSTSGKMVGEYFINTSIVSSLSKEITLPQINLNINGITLNKIKTTSYIKVMDITGNTLLNKIIQPNSQNKAIPYRFKHDKLYIINMNGISQKVIFH